MDKSNIAVKPPTSTDLKILERLQKGHPINNIIALNVFKTTGLRDSIFRLRKAGYEIESDYVYYKNNEGKTKHYVNYFIKKKVA